MLTIILGIALLFVFFYVLSSVWELIVSVLEFFFKIAVLMFAVLGVMWMIGNVLL
jgi:hypothetical protein